MTHFLRAARLGAALAGLGAAPALAGGLAPLQGFDAHFANGASMLVYYSTAADGFHVIATVQSDDTPTQAVFRFTATLTDGQSAEVSVPRAVGQSPAAFKISRHGEQLAVLETPLVTAGR